MLSQRLQTMLDNHLPYLPPVTAKALASFDWSTTIITLGKLFGIHMDEIEALQEIILKSMIGLLKPEDFETNLINALAVSPSEAEKIISALNQKIFEPIHDYIMRGGQPEEPLHQSGIIPEPQPDLDFFAEPIPHPLPSETSSVESLPDNELILPERTPTLPNIGNSFDALFTTK